MKSIIEKEKVLMDGGKMEAVGIVVEYNPFHNGHFYHVQESRNNTKADVVIAVMSGNFLQRGEPALVDKWHRTKMALLSGVDIVIELPYIFSTANAPLFAEGAIQLLNAIGCRYFSFGSEEGNIEPFLNTAQLIHNYNDEYNQRIKQYVQTGLSYPQSLYKAYEALQLKVPNEYIDLSQPNNILGFHYIDTALKLELPIIPTTVKRVQAGYHDVMDSSSTIASATGIRKALFEEKNLQAIEKVVPKDSFNLLERWEKEYGFINWETFWPFLRFTLLRYTPSQLTQFADVSEGIEYALIKHVKTSHSFADFMSKIKSKRYTWTRLQRMLTHILTGITKDELFNSTHPSYIRLLGMTKKGQEYLSYNKKNFTLPLISRVASIQDPILELDIRAAQIYGEGVRFLSNKKIDGDYQTPPIRI